MPRWSGPPLSAPRHNRGMEGRARHLAALVACALVASACTSPSPADEPPADPGAGSTSTTPPARDGQVTLAFGGDVHFEGHAGRLLDRPGGLGPIARTLRAADVAMVNLETPVTRSERRDPKELENAGDRYWFRTRPAAVDVLADAGVDVVSVANNHAGDYGAAGLQDTLAAGQERGVAMVGAGRGEAAYDPHVVEVGDLEVAFLAADGVQREGASDVWSASTGTRRYGVGAGQQRRGAGRRGRGGVGARPARRGLPALGPGVPVLPDAVAATARP